MATPVTWFEIIGKDALALQKFYGDVFGWKMTPPVPEMGNYSMLEKQGEGIGGGIGSGGDAGNRVTVYVEVDDPQAYLDKITQAGGTVIMPVTTITEATTIAMFTDPAGNIGGLLKANPT
jgi:predicted enzyme related to lactoylglutathione lyase